MMSYRMGKNSSRFFLGGIIAVMLATPLWAFAQGEPKSVFVKAPEISKESVIKAFKYYTNVSPTIRTTSVVEVPFQDLFFSLPVFAVYNKTAQSFEPYYYYENQIETPGRAVGAEGTSSNLSFLTDGDYKTYIQFPLTGELSKGYVVFDFEKPINASGLSFTLDQNVALPEAVGVQAYVGGKYETLMAPMRLRSGMASFPQTTSSRWRVDFEYVQPLRISEIKFNDLSPRPDAKRALRFLAQPGASYEVYFEADRYVQASTKESGNLAASREVVLVDTIKIIENNAYLMPDADGDGWEDARDNCTNVYNSDQKDENQNGLGDVCEDYDLDGHMNSTDNCVEIPNSRQEDTDADGVGDICDNFENRTTERMPWLPWAGIVVAGVVLFGLFIMVWKHKGNAGLPGPSL